MQQQAIQTALLKQKSKVNWQCVEKHDNEMKGHRAVLSLISVVM